MSTIDLLATLTCKDQPGIVHAMTTAVLNSNGNIIEKIELIHILTEDHNNVLVNNPRIDISYNTSKLSNSSSLESK